MKQYRHEKELNDSKLSKLKTKLNSTIISFNLLD